MGYDIFCNNMRKSIDRKIDYLVYGKSLDNIFKMCLFYFLIVIMFQGDRYFYLYFSIFTIVFSLSLCVYMLFNRVGLAICDGDLVIAKFKGFGFKIKDVLEIDFANVRFINYRNIFGLNYVVISFIDENGALMKLRLGYRNFVIGFNIDEQKKNAKEMAKFFKEKERILDKGDF